MREFITWIMPESASTMSGSVDQLTYFIMYVSVFFFVLITIGMIAFIIKFRKRSDDDVTSSVDHSTIIEVIWTAIPTLLLAVMFVWGVDVYMRMNIPPKNSLEIKVTGQKWFWTFGYPNGAVSNEFVIPVNTAVKTLISSKDVLHGMYIPAFRTKMDALPNRYTVSWFEATKTGEYPLYCTKYCGTSHSQMITTVRVLSQQDFESWLAESSGPADGVPLSEYGEKLYNKYACNTCHSLDGSAMNGPTWQGLWQSDRNFEAGPSVKADENYIRESILEPQAKIVKGYAPIMPSYQGILKEKDIEALIEFIKTVE
jgi:cytochrome c oxidase subunit 2